MVQLKANPSSQIGGATPQWYLFVKEPQIAPRRCQFDLSSITIGRSDECDLQIQDPFASAQHARLSVTASGLYHLTDLKSANGTLVNGRPVSEVYIRRGDQISIGRSILSLDALEATQTTSGQEITAVIPRPGQETHLPNVLLTSISQAVKALARGLTAKQLIQSVLENAVTINQADRGFVLLHDPETQLWSVGAKVGPMSFEDQGFSSAAFRQNPHLKEAHQAIDSGNTILINPTDDPHVSRTVLVAPIVVGRTRLGVIQIERRASVPMPPLQPTHKECLETMAAIIAQAIQQDKNAEALAREIRTRTTMQRYLSPQVVEQVMSQKQSRTLGGRDLHASILFSDIRGFTKFSSSLEPARLVQQLNEYFSVMAKVIIHHEGHLDKFIGDAIMAVFGIPEPRPDDAKRSIAAALEMQRRLTLLNSDWQTRGWQPFEMGIGINTGKVISGNIGSTQRMEYTVLGDTVNVASRLCSVADASQTVVAAQTMNGLTDEFRFEPIELPELKGKNQGEVKAYQVRPK